MTNFKKRTGLAMKNQTCNRRLYLPVFHFYSFRI